LLHLINPCSLSLIILEGELIFHSSLFSCQPANRITGDQAIRLTQFHSRLCNRARTALFKQRTERLRTLTFVIMKVMSLQVLLTVLRIGELKSQNQAVRLKEIMNWSKLLVGATVSVPTKAATAPQNPDNPPGIHTNRVHHRRKNSKVAKVSRGVGEGAKDTGKDVGKGGERVGEGVAKGSERTAKGTAVGFKDASKATAKGAEKTGRATENGVKKVGRVF
jgi:hypothetical protein